MKLAHVCLACRRNLRCAGAQKVAQRTFVSLSTPSPPKRNEEPGWGGGNKKDAPESQSSGGKAEWEAMVVGTRKPIARPFNPADQLEALFEEALGTDASHGALSEEVNTNHGSARTPMGKDNRETIDAAKLAKPKSNIRPTPRSQDPLEAIFEQTLRPSTSKSALSEEGNFAHGYERTLVGRDEWEAIETTAPAKPIGDNRPIHRSQDQLETLFEQTIRPTSGFKAPLRPTLASYQLAAALKSKIADTNVPAVEAWDFFLQEFGPDNGERSPTPKPLRESASSIRPLMKKILTAKSSSKPHPRLPTFTEISRVYAQLGVLVAKDWMDMMYVLIEQILTYDTSLAEGQGYEVLVSDLIGSWNVVHRKIPSSKQPEIYHDYTSEDGWVDIPVIKESAVLHLHKQKRGLTSAFRLLMPKWDNLTLVSANLPLLAIATYHILTREPTYEYFTRHAAPLILSIEQIIVRFPSIDSRYSSQKPKTPAGRKTTLPIPSLAKIPAAHMIYQVIEKAWDEIWEWARRATSAESFLPFERAFKRINRIDLIKNAMANRDGPGLEKLWNDYKTLTAPVPSSAATSEHITSPSTPLQEARVPECNTFIYAFMTVQLPNRAVDVWNHMVTAGLSPDEYSWQQMIIGCTRIGDWQGIENVWSKMADLKIKPDARCWKARIAGLLECGQIPEAMQALDRWGRAWLAAARKIHGEKNVKELKHLDDIGGIIKPEITTVNAAIHGLFQIRSNGSEAHQVLKWASKFGVRPDIQTYNILLRPLIRDGQLPEAMSLLKNMHKDGVTASPATFVTILDETFRSAEVSTVEQQLEIVNTIFAEMAAAGVKANHYTYNKIVHELLALGTDNMKAVNAIISRMAQENIAPTAPMYTDVLNHYFNRIPPDLDAARALIADLRLRSARLVEDDGIFWDQVLYGYAKSNDVTAALKTLRQMRENPLHMKPEYRTYHMLLRCLAHNDEWDFARTLVNTLYEENEGFPMGTGKKARQQEQFWALAVDLKLLDQGKCDVWHTYH